MQTFMQRPTQRLLKLGALGIAGTALVTAAACSTNNVTPGGGTAGTGVLPSGGSGGAAGAAAGSAAVAGSTAGGASGGAMAAGGGGGVASVGGGGTGGGTAPTCKAVTPINGSGLTISAPDISAFKYAAPPSGNLAKMAYDPVGKVIVILDGANGSMYSLDPNVALPTTAMTSPVTSTQPYDSGYQAAAGYGNGQGFIPYRGIAFGPDGSLYVLAVRGGGNVGVNIQKGAPPAQPGGQRTWTTLVTTDQGFPASGTDYDHTFSGIAVSPDGMSLFFSSGSRTEHGEMRGPVREVPLSSCILKVSSSTPTTLTNDQTALMPYMFADGTRNSFDLEFNAEGDLIGTENGPDIDLPDEVNFIEQGKHYGFPWRFGDTDNPTRDPAYDRNGDKRLQAGYGAINSYVADPDFPAPPGAFTDPIRNLGPDANFMRADRDAATPTKAGAEGLAGVTGHRSPLGLAFDKSGALCGEYYKAGLMLSYGALVPASFNDPGEDLLLLNLTKANGTYSMTAKQIAKGIKAPMDSVLVGNRLFTIGFGNASQIFVFELPTP